MEPNERKFAQRFRRWIDGYELQVRQAAAIWLRISNSLELGQGSPVRAPKFRPRSGSGARRPKPHKHKEIPS